MADFACNRNLSNYFQPQTANKQIDPKAVGSHLAHMPLSRRCSIPSFTLSNTITVTPAVTESSNQLHLSQSCNSESQQQNEVKRGHRKLDRSQSEPASRAPGLGLGLGIGALAAVPSNANRYKTELCRPYEESGSCKYGDKCQFAHGFHELRSLTRHPKYKTELCKTYHTVGFCPYGPRCHFVHNADEVRTQSPSQELIRNNKPGAFKVFGGSSASDSPSPPSSLSESPTSSSSSFFSDDLFAANPFSPTSKNFRFNSDFGSGIFNPQTITKSAFNEFQQHLDNLSAMRMMIPVGYYKQEEKTREDFYEEEGRKWFRTGDIGEIHPDGVLKIIDRKKDLVKLQFGEYVSLGKVEAELKTCSLVDNICVYADSSKMFVVALVVPSPNALKDLATRTFPVGRQTDSFEELCADPEMEKAVLKELQGYAKKCRLEKFEVPQAVKLIPDTWTPDMGLVTAAFKLKRKEIQNRYQKLIDRMYS